MSPASIDTMQVCFLLNDLLHQQWSWPWPAFYYLAWASIPENIFDIIANYLTIIHIKRVIILIFWLYFGSYHTPDLLFSSIIVFTLFFNYLVSFFRTFKRGLKSKLITNNSKILSILINLNVLAELGLLNIDMKSRKMPKTYFVEKMNLRFSTCANISFN